MSAPYGKGLRLSRRAKLVCFAFCVANVAYLAASLIQGSWLIGPDGLAIATDFINVWTGGRHVLDGNPVAAYDTALHKAAEIAALGRPFEGEYPWLYPPTFFFVVTLLAMLPYVTAHAAWLLLTFPAYVAAIHGIIRDRMSILLALAFPGIVSNFMVGQNGFVTAALVGGTLIFLDRQPVLAGSLLGLLSFKPHLGVLIPVVLLFGGYWRVIIVASAVTAGLILASWLAFGTSPWLAFFHALSTASQVTLSDGRAEWAKLQSIFGLVRALGGSENLAWGLQVALSCATAVILCAMWRSQVPFNLKAAALAAGILFATPYLFVYDLVVLAVAMAFFLREMQSDGARSGEMLGLAGAAVLVMIFPLVKIPVGFIAVVVVAALIAKRAIFPVSSIGTAAAAKPLMP